MKNNLFFKPTTQYRKFLILDSIDNNNKITQRDLSKRVGISVSMINTYLMDYEKLGLIKKKYQSKKTIYYSLTKTGVENKKVLNIGYLSSSLNIYNNAKKNVLDFLEIIKKKGFRNIILYGAGEVAEILLQTIELNESMKINIVGIIDDDLNKQGKRLVSHLIESNQIIKSKRHDCILISSYTNNSMIFEKLNSMEYDLKKIIQFFE